MEPLNEGVNADHLAFNIHQRAATVSGVNQSISLDEILIHGPAFKAVDDIRTALGADMAKSYAEIEAKRCADGDSELADARLGGVAQLGNGQLLSLNLDHRNIRLRIHASDRR